MLRPDRESQGTVYERATTLTTPAPAPSVRLEINTEPAALPATAKNNERVAGRIQLTSGQTSQATAAGVISIPNAAPAPSASEQSSVVTTGGKKTGTKQPQKIIRWTGLDGTMFKRNTKTGVTKTRRFATWLHGNFIKDVDANCFDEDCFEADAYPQPIVLVGNTVDEAAVADESGDDQSAAARKQPVLARKLTDIQPTLQYAWGDFKEDELPDDFYDRIDYEPKERAATPQTVLQWAPTNLWYHPLYFQDVALERYGHTRKPWMQPLVSSGRFFGQLAGLPYQMVLHPPKSREFALGYYQPGEWAPKKRYQIPFNEEAAATEFLWVTGLILLIP